MIMKSKKYILLLMVLLFLKHVNATVHTLNNNNPTPGQYTIWSAVESHCNPGDTVYVSGSANSYGDITVTVDNLTIIGTGFDPQKQNPLVSSFGTILITTTTASFNGIVASVIRQATSLGATYITIEHCMTVIDITQADYDAHYTLINNILYQYDTEVAINAGFRDTYGIPTLTCIARNNLFFGSIRLYGNTNFYNRDSVVINNSLFSHNVFMRRGDANGGTSGISYNQLFPGLITFNNTSFINNIVNSYNAFSPDADFINTTCLNNFIRNGNLTSLPNDNGTSFLNVIAFTNFCPSLCAFNNNQNYNLLPSSPLINAGTDGEDIGVYGGHLGLYFTMSGEPPIPQVKEFALSATSGLSGHSFTASITSTVSDYFGPNTEINQAEYFWDRDYGIGTGTIVNTGSIFDEIIPSDSVNFTISIHGTASLSQGNHVLYIRTRDNTGRWSLSEGRPYYVYPSISSAEYFWDIDPGCGNGIAFTSFVPDDSLNLNENISTVGLSAGSHTLYTRTQGLNNLWSIAEGRSIYIYPWIKQGEYFWETDPGFGNATSFYVDNAVLKNDTVNETISFSTTGRPRGVNNFYIRFKDSDENWGLTEARQINLVNGIKAAEYYFDTDPGFGQGNAIPVNPFDTIFNFSGTITLPQLAGGTHKIYFRTQDLDDKWSLPEEKSFYVYINTLQATTIKKAEYFFDADPGVGNGISLANFTDSATVNYNDSIVLPQLPGGLHTLFFRTCDNNNHWSLVEPKGVSFYSNTLQAEDITGAECFFDADPGVGNGISLPNVIAASTVNYLDSIVLPQLTGGFHTMFVRTKDNNNHWSLSEPKAIYIYSNSVIASSITAAGYFIDTDAGITNDYPISITTGAIVSFNSVIMLPSISNGVHTFNLRTRDTNGKWSIHESRVFFAGTANAAQIINAEYFLDTDPGVGNATNIAITTPAATVNQCSFLTLPAIATGAHKFYLRTKDNRGIWALQEPISITGIATSSVSIAQASPVNLCAGSSTILTASTTGGPWTVQWYNGCALIAGADSLTLTVTAAGTYSIVVTNGSISQSATVIVNEVALPITYIVTGGGNYCSSQEGGLEIVLSGCQADVNYQLILNGNTNVGLPSGCDGNSIIFADLTLAGNYTVNATTILGSCTSTMSNSATITVEQAITWYIDEDGDGFGEILASLEACAQPSGYVSDSTDCDDTPITGASIHPFALEVCGNNIDDNCNGQVDEGCFASVNIKLFVEGYYIGNNLMQPVLFNSGLSTNDTLCDTVIVELHDPFNAATLISSDTIVVDVHGNGNVIYPASFIGGSYYFAIRVRNAIETWSKLPVTLGIYTNLDFTIP